MLGIVLANNFLQLFIFWELVGVSSYLLIGFWYGKASAADAAKKAFITNRLGDFGFILGILMRLGCTALQILLQSQGTAIIRCEADRAIRSEALATHWLVC